MSYILEISYYNGNPYLPGINNLQQLAPINIAYRLETLFHRINLFKTG